MTDKFLIPLDTEGKWALGADSLQWIIYRINTSKGEKVLQGRSFVNSDQDLLRRCFREYGVDLTDDAETALGDLPHTFNEFAEIYNPKSGKGRKGSGEAKVPVVSPALAKWNGWQAASNGEPRQSPHRTGTALAKEWFEGYESYQEGNSEPHKPTPRKTADEQEENVPDNTFKSWDEKPKTPIPDYMLIKPKNPR